MRTWITLLYGIEIRTFTLTEVGYLRRSNAVPMTTVAADARALERRALPIP